MNNQSMSSGFIVMITNRITKINQFATWKIFKMKIFSMENVAQCICENNSSVKKFFTDIATFSYCWHDTNWLDLLCRRCLLSYSISLYKYLPHLCTLLFPFESFVHFSDDSTNIHFHCDCSLCVIFSIQRTY